MRRSDGLVVIIDPKPWIDPWLPKPKIEVKSWS